MSEHVLVKWSAVIAFAKRHVRSKTMGDPAKCIRDLAAEVRVLREHNTHLANNLDRAIHNLAESGLEIQRIQKRVAELEHEVLSYQQFLGEIEAADRECKAGVPLLTDADVFGVADIPCSTVAVSQPDDLFPQED